MLYINIFFLEHLASCVFGFFITDCFGKRYDGVPYSSQDFHQPYCEINNYGNADEVDIVYHIVRDLKTSQKQIFTGSKLLSGRTQRPGRGQTVSFVSSTSSSLLELEFDTFLSDPHSSLIMVKTLSNCGTPGTCERRSLVITTTW